MLAVSSERPVGL